MRKTTWIRLINYEYWPYWIFYLPAYFYYFYLAIRSGKWVYFSVLNPYMNFAGAFLSSKIESLNKLPKKWVPKTLVVDPEEEFSTITLSSWVCFFIGICNGTPQSAQLV
jgi:hypothetical protein